MENLYQSARLVGASGLLKKNKGIMLVGIGGNACQLRFRGLSGGSWIESTAGLTLGTTESVAIIPVAVYGVTLGSGSVFELN